METFKKGEIVIGTLMSRDEAYHPIIYWEKHKDGAFYGLVLTHSKRNDNIFFPKEFITDGRLSNKESYIVGRFFIKPDEWGPYKRIGQISNEGINFIEKIIIDKQPLFWSEYI